MIHISTNCHISKIEKLICVNRLWDYLETDNLDLICILQKIVIKTQIMGLAMEIVIVHLKF
jgi:hypothetical protein